MFRKYWIFDLSRLCRMSGKITEVKEEITDAFNEVMESYGLNPTLMKIYLALFFAREPLGLKEISGETGYSVSTICGMMDIIEKLTDVHKFKKPGSKKIYYECQHDVKIILKKKMNETRGHVKKLIKVLEEAEEKLAEDKNPDAVRIRGHIADMRKEYERINSLWGLLTTMHIIGKEK